MDDVIEVVTQFVLAGATAGKPTGMRAPKHASSKIDLERMHQIADACPDLLERIADTEIHEEWLLTDGGTRRVESIRSRVELVPMFALPSDLPMIEDMTTYQLVLHLENDCGFMLMNVPRKIEEISFRPNDPSSPRH